jgi:hypothetical protein
VPDAAESKPSSLVSTVVVSLAISILSLAVTSVNVYSTTLRPARLAIFVPFQIQSNSQLQTVLVFMPTDTPGFANGLLARGGKTFRYTIVLNTTAGDVTIAKDVSWPGVTNGALDKAAFGVAAAPQDVNGWFDATTRVPYPATSP